jgi:tetratricopeptide (TPR) repeat protein
MWLAASLLVLLSGCANSIGSMVAELDDHAANIELVDVPFFSQVTDQCGPAALASVLHGAGVEISAAELKPLVYIPERQGSLQLELIAATRQFGRIPYEIEPKLSALVAELDAGRPVLVLQNLGIRVAPIWHYAVVVGYIPDGKEFILRSGDNERLLMGAKAFTRTWKGGRFWAMVALEPGELPVNAVANRYLHAVAATESSSDPGKVVPAYRVATEKWPASEIAWLGLGNALYSDGEMESAGKAYRRLLEIQPANSIAMNNLSEVYLRLGCRDEALVTITTALSQVDEDDPVRSHLLSTRMEIQQSNSGSQCL